MNSTFFLIPEFVFAPCSQAETGESVILLESSDWLEKQQKALSVAKESIQTALDN